MKTIYAGLPFYDDIEKQDYRRVNSQIPFYMPNNEIIPFQFILTATAVPNDVYAYIVDKNGSESTIDAKFPQAIEWKLIGSVYYLVYRGGTLSSNLPYGTYYIRIDVDYGSLDSYYSEQFVVINTSSGNWCKIECSNTHDLGDILYATGGFEQVYYLNTQLNYPLNETVEVGEEKDGEFITEKLVTKYIYRISDYVSKALQRCLLRLPQHDSITITDEMGDTYNPAVGNVKVTDEWPNFDVCHIVIQFNDGANTAFKWTYGMSDMS